jgi:toxin-antitoxin system PIN domain toxin
LILPDVNVLIYAFRTDSEDHERYKDWLESVVNGPTAYGIAPQVLSGVVRICTHPRIFRRPSSRADAFTFCRTLLEQSNATVTVPGARHWSIFEDLCGKAKATGNLVQDAWFAALAIESGCEWITTDRDYARFPGLNWREPLGSP